MVAIPAVPGREVGLPGAPSTYSGVTATPEDFGSQIGAAQVQAGRAIEGVGNNAMNFAIGKINEEKERQRANRVMENDLQDMEAANNLFYVDKQNPDGTVTKGLYNRNGTEAEGSGDELRKFYQNQLKTLSSEADPAVRMARQKRLNQILEQHLPKLSQKESQERKQVANQFADAAIATAVNGVVRSGGDPKILATADDDIARFYKSAHHGDDPTWVNNKIADAKSKMRANVLIERMVTDPVGAEAQFKAWADEGLLLPPETKTLRDDIKRASAVYHDTAILKGADAAARPAGQVALTLAGMEVDPYAFVVGKLETGGVKGGDAGRAAAVSTAGAMGFMQIMPGTAKDISRELGDGHFSKDTSVAEIHETYKKNPQLNVIHGMYYFNKMLKRYGGDPVYALAAYNHGPGDRKGRNGEKIPGPDTIFNRGGEGWESLPEETRNYVQRGMAELAKVSGFGPRGIEHAVPDPALPNMPKLPKPGERMTPDKWTLTFYKAEDMINDPQAQFVDARAATMADELGRRFAELNGGLKVPINVGNIRAGAASGGHSSNSRHYHGDAFDFQIQSLKPEQKAQFLQLARQIGFTGVGFYGENGHLHLDTGAARHWEEKGPRPQWASGIDLQKPLRPAGSDPTQPPSREVMVRAAAAGSSTPQAYGMPSVSTNITTAPAGGPEVAPALAPAADLIKAGLNPHALPDRAAGARWIEANTPDPVDRERRLKAWDKKQDELERDVAKEARKLKHSYMLALVNGKSFNDLDQRSLAYIETHAPGSTKALMDYAEGQEKRRDVTDYAAYKELVDMPGHRLAEVDLTSPEYASRLSKADLKEMLNRQAKWVNPDEADNRDAELFDRVKKWTSVEAEATTLGSGNATATSSGRRAEFSAEQNARRGLLEKMAVDMVRQRERELKRTMSGEEIQKLVRTELLVPVPGQDKFAFEIGDAVENQALERNNQELPEVGDSVDFAKVPAEIRVGVATNYRRLTGTEPTVKAAMAHYKQVVQAVKLGSVPIDPKDPVSQRFTQILMSAYFNPTTKTWRTREDGVAWNDPIRMRQDFAKFLARQQPIQQVMPGSTSWAGRKTASPTEGADFVLPQGVADPLAPPPPPTAPSEQQAAREDQAPSATGLSASPLIGGGPMPMPAPPRRSNGNTTGGSF